MPKKTVREPVRWSLMLNSMSAAQRRVGRIGEGHSNTFTMSNLPRFPSILKLLWFTCTWFADKIPSELRTHSFHFKNIGDKNRTKVQCEDWVYLRTFFVYLCKWNIKDEIDSLTFLEKFYLQRLNKILVIN